MIFTYLKLKFYRTFQKRFVPRKTKILNYKIYYNDPRSLYSQFKDIFKNKIYHFNSDKRSPVVVDGGGNIGLSVLYFKHIYPHSKITVFEPDPEIIKILIKNIEANKLTDVTVLNYGLYSIDGRINFSPDSSDGGRIDNVGKSSIEVRKLSSYIDKEVDFLKLDIEGSELAVLEELNSSKKIKNIRELCLEWHSFPGQKQDLGRLLAILENNKYKYVIYHFEYKANKSIRTPLNLKHRTKFYLIIHAKRYDLLD